MITTQSPLKNQYEHSNQIAIEARVPLKIQFIKANYHFISWEENARLPQMDQLVSNLYPLGDAGTKAAQISSLFHSSENKGAIITAQSRQFPNQYRVVINLDKFHESTLFFQSVITSFLNENCIPTCEMWNKLGDKGAKFSKEWKMDDKGFICLIAPPVKYVCDDDLIHGSDFKKFILSAFQALNKIHGSNFKNNLIIENHKRATYYYFKNHFVCGDLLRIALAHNKMKLQKNGLVNLS
jgi:hypothetical protein